MLFRVKKIAVYSENHTKQVNAVCGQNAELQIVKAGDTYSYHYAFFINSEANECDVKPDMSKVTMRLR
jgi:hypothetical protein